MPIKYNKSQKLSYRGGRRETETAADERKVVLRAEDICMTFGTIKAVAEVSFELLDGEVLALIGPNGAGKSALLNCINGFYHPQRGRVYFHDKDITHLPPHKRAMLGIGRTFQGLQVYAGMTVVDTIMSGRHFHMKTNPMQCAIYWPWTHKEEVEHREYVEEVIDFLEIEGIRKAPVGELSYGLRKRVDLARALAMEPDTLLLDEPMAGMNLEEKEDLARFILDVNESLGTTIMVVEHDMEVVMDIAQRILAMDWGRLIATGTPAEIKTNDTVVKAYLGVG